MSRKPLRCRLGLHQWVQARPRNERSQGPDHKVCRRCHRSSTGMLEKVPPGFFHGLGGGGSGGGMQ